ncbi:MAG: DUF2786 domain-containing protein [Granulosicoccus sp.]|nr:DUF2786 domain-containing protein [Granulosicoccus sp.]
MKTDDREKLLARIRKLYAMSRESESSPHEAEIAMRRCQSLMSKFGISEEDLQTSEFGSSTIGRDFRAVPTYVGVLGSAVALLHDCICVKGRTIEFRGFSIDAEVASLTFGYLADVMERSLKSRKTDGSVAPGRSASFDYRTGFALAVLERARRIDRERQQSAGGGAGESSALGAQGNTGGTDVPRSSSLIIRKRQIVNDNCMEGLVSARPRRVRYRNGEAHSAGSNDGATVSLDKQVGGRREKGLH